MGNHDIFMAALKWMRLCPLCGRGAYRRLGEALFTWKARPAHRRCVVERVVERTGGEPRSQFDMRWYSEMWELEDRDGRETFAAVAAGRRGV